MVKFLKYNKIDYSTLECIGMLSDFRVRSILQHIDNIDKKTFLDIGTNSGALALNLVNKNALFVHAIDIQNTYTDNLRNVCHNRFSNIKVEHIDFFQLSSTEKYDVVFFIEILHWAVSQCGSIDKVIKKLSELTKDMLFLEFPWDINDPSIKNNLKLSDNEYNSLDIFKTLDRYFYDISILSFPCALDETFKNRILVKCQNKKYLSQYFKFGIRLNLQQKQDSNTCIAINNDNAIFIKKFNRNSTIYTYGKENFENLFVKIEELGNSSFVKNYRLFNNCFIGCDGELFFTASEYLPSIGINTRENIYADNVIDCCYQISDDFLNLFSSIGDKFVEKYPLQHFNFIELEKIKNTNCIFSNDLFEFNLFEKFYKDTIEFNYKLSKNIFDSFSHADLNISNFFKMNNRYYVCDLEHIRPGTIYLDGLFALILYGANIDNFKQYIKIMKKYREINDADINLTYLYSIERAFSMIKNNDNSIFYKDAILKFSFGFKSFRTYCKEYL